MTLAQPDGLASLSMASTNKLLLAQDFKDVRCRVRGWGESLWFRHLRFGMEVSKPMAKKGLGILFIQIPYVIIMMLRLLGLILRRQLTVLYTFQASNPHSNYLHYQPKRGAPGIAATGSERCGDCTWDNNSSQKQGNTVPFGWGLDTSSPLS